MVDISLCIRVVLVVLVLVNVLLAVMVSVITANWNTQEIIVIVLNRARTAYMHHCMT